MIIIIIMEEVMPTTWQTAAARSPALKIQDFFAQQVIALTLDRKKLIEFIDLVAQRIDAHPEIFSGKFGEFSWSRLDEEWWYIFFEKFSVFVGGPHRAWVTLVAFQNPFQSVRHIRLPQGEIFSFVLKSDGEFSRNDDWSLFKIALQTHPNAPK